ncbi:helix-turn-helix domain-containing protein [Microbacterium sp. NPDC091382]|uniref:helix-turn-helix domain-containing protein n=1 Tax=Microbacterium sp. NPDC091382 TaxID=3364210 RepID=UPI0037FDA4A5
MLSITDQSFLERRRSGISKARVAEMTGVAASNVSAHESGARRPTIATPETMADALDLRLLALNLRSRRTVLGHSDAVRRQPDFLGLRRLRRDLSSVDPATAVLLAFTAPKHVSPEWDAAIAGVVEWCLENHNAPLPRWVSSWGFSLDTPWHPEGTCELTDGVIPGPLRRRNVFVTDVELKDDPQLEDRFWSDHLAESDL